MKGERGYNAAFENRIFTPGTMSLTEMLSYFRIRTEPVGVVVDRNELKKMPRAERVAAERRTAAGKKHYERQLKEYVQQFATGLESLGLSKEDASVDAIVAARLAMLAGMYFPSQSELHVTRVEGKEPFIEIRNSDGTGGATRFFHLERSVNGEIQYTLGESDVFSLEGSFANVQNPDAYLGWVNTIFGDATLQPKYHSFASGTFEGSGRRAQRATVSMSGSAHSKDEATKLYQAYEITKRLVRAVEWAIPQTIDRVTNPDWEHGAVVLGGEMYLMDFVQDETYKSVTAFLDGQGLEVMAAVRGVNARLTSDTVQPYLEIEEEQPFFGHRIKTKVVKRLAPVPLIQNLPSLKISSINLWAGTSERNFDRHNQMLTIPPEHQIELAVDFYRDYYHPKFDIRAQLYKLLDEWMASRGARRKGKTQESTPSGLHEHLAAIGLSISDLEGKTLVEQKEFVKQAWQKAAMDVHPDRNKADAHAEEKTKRVLKAREYFKDDKHFSV